MNKPEILPSSQREKKRYIVFEIMAEDKIKFNKVVEAIWHSMLDLFGEVTSSDINFWVMKDRWDYKTQKGIIKCSHIYVDQVRTALSLLTRIGDTRVFFNTLGESGTIKTATEKYF